MKQAGKKIKRAYRKTLFREKPTKPKDIQALAQEMFNYVLKETECHSIDDFIVHAQISYPEIRQLCEESAVFAKSYSLTKSLISSRIQKGWQKGKLDRTYALKFIELYNEEYRQMQLDKLALRTEIAEEARNVEIVEVERFIPVTQDEYDKMKQDEARA